MPADQNANFNSLGAAWRFEINDKNKFEKCKKKYIFVSDKYSNLN